MDEKTLQRITLLVVALSSFTTPVMLSAPNVAVPAIAEALRADAVAVGWVSTAYLLASAVFLLPFGKIADSHGRKRVFLAGVAVVALGGVLCALARSFPQLVAARVFQGVGAGMIYATGLALLSSVFPKERRGAVIGVSTASVYFGLTAGPLFGGWVTHHFGWRMVFVLAIPLLVLSLLLGLTRLRGEWRGTPAPFDWPGALIYGLAVAALMIGVSTLPALSGALLAAAGLAGLVVFFVFEHRRTHPLFDVSLFYGNRVFTFSCLASLLMYSATFANTFLMSLFLQKLKGLDAQSAGLVLMAQPLMMALLSPMAGRLSDRVQPRVLASTGMTLCAAGLMLLAGAGADTPVALIILYLAVVGVGFALFSSPNMNAIMGSVEPRHYGLAGSSASTVRVLGQMLSMGLITLVTALVMGRLPIAPEHYGVLMDAIRASFAIAAVLCVAGIGLSLSRGHMKR